jgi:catechol 2,3-dioxygenase-like lactoylglutathione lyase family enzyme
VIGPVVVSTDTANGAGAHLQLIVTDIDAARAELSGRGVEVSEVQQLDPRDGGKFMFFADPDGNQWAVQEVRERVGAQLG